MITKLRLVFPITIFFACFYGFSQTNYWSPQISQNAVTANSLKRLDFKKAKVFSLEKEAFAKQLSSSASSKQASKVVYFPDEEGKLIPFQISEAPVLSPQLAKKYPQIKSYVGYGVNDRKNKIRFSVSHNGIQSMMLHADSRTTTFMQKVAKQGSNYVVYNRDAGLNSDTNFICDTKSGVEKSLTGKGSTLKLVDDQTLRKYRIAVSATGEYTQHHGGTIADALAAINATLTRVNEVFETDLGVTLELVPNNDLVIFTNALTDPYSGNLNAEVQNVLTSTIGEANYDVGHLFNKDNDNGNAGFIGSVCRDNQKGSAFSSGTVPEGDKFDLDFVSHELGHQFGANHTWSFESEGTLVQAEPGSGTTIMGYAGIAQANNVAPNGDDYFHYYSIFQIIEYLETTSCAVETPLTNNAPIVDPIGNYIIPKSTAFVLSASATDVDGDILTYAWEQIDDGVVTNTSFGPTNPSGANFRSQRPSLSPQRYFPQLSSVILGNLTQSNPSINSAWETVSDVEREMKFAVTVRDNASGGGQVASGFTDVSVINGAGPFAVTSQATAVSYVAGTTQDITWDVSNTNSTPINAATVDIYLSVDGGVSFPTQLATNVPNDGLHAVLLPGVATAAARVMVKASDNIFFAVNAANFSITASQVVLNFSQLEFSACQPDDIVVPFNYETFLGFAEEVTFSAVGTPVGMGVVFLPATATANNTPVSITFSNTAGVTAGNYPVQITATSASVSETVEIDLNIYNNTFSDVVLSAPADGLLDTGIKQVFQWEDSPNATAYDIEIATDAGFTNIIESTSVIFNFYLASNLIEQTTYFWRVKPKNDCGEGTFGTPFSFTTIEISCDAKSASGLPAAISAIGTPTVISKIAFFEDLTIADVNVNLDITHTFLADLEISLTSPSGTTIILTSGSCGNLANINATFDDEAPSFVCGGTPGISGIVKPLGSLASLEGESLLGEWILQVKDNAAVDGGALNSFSLDVCVEGVFRPDSDNDGVFDDGDDLCLGTPKGTEVDLTGCPVYRFPSDNFSVAIQSETCRNNNDGLLEIDATDTSITYSVTVDGNGVNVSEDFTESYTLANLTAGTYNVCITGTDGAIDYEAFCFDTVINEPAPLDVTAVVTPSGKVASLTLNGGGLYNIELNGVVTQTTDSEITVNLKEGVNTLKVTTNLPCQGVYEKQIFTANEPIIYPNPVEDIAKVFLGAGNGAFNLTIYTADGRFVGTKTYSGNSSEVDLDFTGLPSGMYFISFDGSSVKRTYKVIKR
ncbi:reprolysin-like metallopeptidase [Spongiimicrobium sp. 3-5]|uniref:reprolysin-like metallopeptidase n=1 Tax=Spongiimicrobium sp. 3-5 TaxID=3332596 RepID=UPI0039813805